MVQLDIPREIEYGEKLEVTAVVKPDAEVVSVRFNMESWPTPTDMNYKDNGTWALSISPVLLQEGPMNWELIVNGKVNASGTVNVIAGDDGDSRLNILFIAVFLIIAFVGIEMTFKPGKYGRKKKEPVVEEPVPEPEEFKDPEFKSGQNTESEGPLDESKSD